MAESEGLVRPSPALEPPLSYGTPAVEAAVAAGNAFLLPLKRTTNSVIVIDGHLFIRQCIARSLQSLEPQIDVRSFATSEQCLGNLTEHDLVLYHVHSDGTQLDPASWLDKLKAMLATAPVIILCSAESPQLVHDAFEGGARGFVPTSSTTLEIAVEVIRLVRAGGTFLPPSLLDARRLLDGPPMPAQPSKAGPFTPRQRMVLEHLQLGKANKIIAHDLGMSESTVKVHIRSIMKKMQATNRTEAAYRARTLLRLG